MFGRCVYEATATLCVAYRAWLGVHHMLTVPGACSDAACLPYESEAARGEATRIQPGTARLHRGNPQCALNAQAAK